MMTAGFPSGQVLARRKWLRVMVWTVVFMAMAPLGWWLYNEAEWNNGPRAVAAFVGIAVGVVAVPIGGRECWRYFMLARGRPMLHQPTEAAEYGLSMLVVAPPSGTQLMTHWAFVGWPEEGRVVVYRVSSILQRRRRATTGFAVLLTRDTERIALFGPYGSTWLIGRSSPASAESLVVGSTPDRTRWFIKHATLAGFASDPAHETNETIRTSTIPHRTTGRKSTPSIGDNGLEFVDGEVEGRRR